MHATDGLILVVNHARRDADNLKELLEFMDEPDVQTATPDDWQQALGSRRLNAMFVGADLSNKEVQSLLGDLGNLDPNVPIVLLHESDLT